MIKSTPTYIFFISSEAIYRSDGDGLTAQAMTSRFPRLPGQPAAAVLQTAYANIPKHSGIVLFHLDAWYQTLKLPEGQLAGLAPADVEAVLGFELETFSGLAPDESKILYTLSPPQNGFITCRAMQLAESEIDQLAAATRAANLKLLGITHPAFLYPDEDFQTPAEITSPLLEQWLERWQAEQRRGRTPPFIPPPAPPQHPRRNLIMAGGILAAAILIACLIQFIGGYRLRRAEDVLEQTQALHQRHTQITRQIQTLQQEDAALRRQQQENRQKTNLLKQSTEAFAFLLSALAEACPPSVMLQKLQTTRPFQLQLEGLCSNLHDLDGFFQTLDPALSSTGWELRPKAITGQHLLENGGPWHFTCDIQSLFREVSP